MTKVLKAFLKLFGKGKFVDLDGDGKIESLQQEITSVFSQFKKMNDKLDEVNGTLQEVIEDEKIAREIEEQELAKLIASAEAKLKQSAKVIDKAFFEIKANQKLQEKVQEFIA